MTSVTKQIIYKSLPQVLRVLTAKQDVPQVKSLLKLCSESGLIPHKSGSGVTRDGRKDGKGRPFIVVEGLDGTGKTTLSRSLASKLHMKWMNTPPKNYKGFIKDRGWFDGQDETTKRAYYSLGNYLVACEVLQSEQPVVMDRFWHSTAAYALAHLKKSGELVDEVGSLEWPVDLIQPDLVIFLQVSEQERLRRHATRKAFTNTEEEQTLADDANFRQSVLLYYRSVMGPPFQELTINGEQSESEAKILTAVLNTFPSLDRFVKDKKSL